MLWLTASMTCYKELLSDSATFTMVHHSNDSILLALQYLGFVCILQLELVSQTWHFILA